MKKILLPVCMLAATFAVAQQPDVLDASFGNKGYVLLSPSQNEVDIKNHIITPDNEYVFGGNISGTNKDFFIIKTDKNGTGDAGFGNKGVSIFDPLIGGQEEGGVVAIRPDGKFLIAGGIKAGPDYDAIVMCVDKDGNIDQAFSNSGYSIMPFLGDDKIVKMLVVNNKIYVGGASSVNGKFTDAFIIRLNIDGTLDQSYGDLGGFLLLDINGDQESLEDFVIAGDGSIIAIGRTRDAVTRQYVCKIKPTGIIDSSFGKDGFFLHTEAGNTRFASVELGKSNEIFICGYYDYMNYDIGALWKLDANGFMSTTFGGGNGKVSFNLGQNKDHQLYKMVINDAGNIFIVGTYRDNTGSGFLTPLAVLYRPDGTLNTDFNATGYVIEKSPEKQVMSLYRNVSLTPEQDFLVSGLSLDSANATHIVLAKYKKKAVSIAEVAKGTERITVSPNPSGGSFNISIGGVCATGHAVLYAPTGVQVAAMPAANGLYHVPAHVANGLYYLHIPGIHSAKPVPVVITR